MHLKYVRCRSRSIVFCLLLILSFSIYVKFKTFIDVGLAHLIHSNYLSGHTQFECYQSGIVSNVGERFAIVDDFFMSYSAYHDINSENFIRILGLRYILIAPPIFCAIFQNEADKLFVSLIKGQYVLINENPACLNVKLCNSVNPFDAYYVKCPLPSQPLNSPAIFVALINSSTIEKTDTCRGVLDLPKLKVRLKKEIGRAAHFLSICVSPTHDFDDIDLLKFFINYYIHHGVEKFIFYNRSWTNRVDKYLKSFELGNLVEIVDWPRFPQLKSYDLNDNRIVHYFGQNLATNDCIWRMKYRTQFVLSIDLDEFVTFNDENLTISRKLRDLFSSNASFNGIMFRNRFASFNLTNISPTNPVHLDDKIYDVYGQRSKVLVKPEKVDLFAIHTVWRFKEKRFADGQSRVEPLLFDDQYVMIHWRPKTSVNMQLFETNATEMRKIFPHLFRS